MARHKEMSIYNKIKYTISWNFDGHKKGTVQKKKQLEKEKTGPDTRLNSRVLLGRGNKEN